MQLPSSLGQSVGLGHLRDIDTNHGLTQTLADFSEDLGVLVVSHGLDNSLGALLRITRLENTRADEHSVAAQLHHECGISGSGNTAGGEVDNGKTALLGGLAQKLIRDLKLTSVGTQLNLGVGGILEDGAGAGDLGVDRAHVLDGFNNISGTGLTLGTDHSGTLGDPTKGLAQVAATTDERNLVVVLLHVVDIIGRGKDFGLVDVVNANGFEDLTITHVSCNAGFPREKGSLTWHSTKCPIRALAMTGMVTAAMISLIMLGSDMRATPPWALMSAGTLSRAITAAAPASSAMRACCRSHVSVKGLEVS